MLPPSNSRSRPLLAIAVLAIVAATFAIACAAPPAAAPPPTANPGATPQIQPPVTGGSPTAAPSEPLADAMTVSTVNMAPSWDPLWPLSSSGMQVGRLYGESLVILDLAGTVKPLLATEWRQVNPTTVHFTLRPNVRFHNGQPLTPADVAATVQRMLTASDPQQVSTRNSRFPGIAGAQVIDERTVAVTTREPDAQTIQKLASLFILPASQASEPIIQGIPIGTGPYRGADYVQTQRMVVEAFDGYWGTKALVKRATLASVPDNATATAGVRAGDIDVAYDIPADLGEQLKTSGHTQVILNTADVNTFDINPAFEAFRDRRVRIALNLAVDKKGLAESVYNNTGKLSQGQFAYEGQTGFNPTLQAYPYDPPQARRLLQEAGISNLRISGGGSSVSRAPLEVAQAYFRDIGIDMEINIYPPARLASLQNNIEPGKDPVWSTRVNFFNLNDPAQALENYVSTAASRRYANPQFDAIMDQARSELDPQRRGQLLQQAAKIMVDDPPNIIVQQYGYVYGVSNKIRDFQPLYDTSYNLAQVRKLR